MKKNRSHLFLVEHMAYCHGSLRSLFANAHLPANAGEVFNG